MARAAERYEDFEPKDRASWRRWLQRHHAKSAGVWLIRLKQSAGPTNITYDEACEEAICFGWVDSLPRKLDETRSRLLVTPRKPGSGWSKPNKDRVAKLEAAELMTPAGRAVIDAAKADGSWTKLDAVERLDVPGDLAAALDDHDGARREWDDFPRSVKRGILEWILQAKKAETRAKRVAETASKAAIGERANQWRSKTRT
ncbi:MAG: YdeI/OmpD-associated family protein [Planctomycetota bacterium]